MKKILMIFLVAVLACGAVSAQTTYSKWYYTGARIDYKPTASWHITGGTALPVGNNLWVIPGFDLGGFDSAGVRVSALEAEVSWMPLSGGLGAIHVFLAPGVDWISAEPSADAYLTGAVGTMWLLKLATFVKSSSPAGQWISDHVGVWGAWKYKTNFQAGSAFPAGNSFGVGLAVKY